MHARNTDIWCMVCVGSVWSHDMTYVSVLGAWMMCAKRESSWSIAPVCAGMLPTRTLGPLGGVCDIPAQQG